MGGGNDSNGKKPSEKGKKTKKFFVAGKPEKVEAGIFDDEVSFRTRASEKLSLIPLWGK